MKKALMKMISENTLITVPTHPPKNSFTCINKLIQNLR